MPSPLDNNTSLFSANDPSLFLDDSVQFDVTDFVAPSTAFDFNPGSFDLALSDPLNQSSSGGSTFPSFDPNSFTANLGGVSFTTPSVSTPSADISTPSLGLEALPTISSPAVNFPSINLASTPVLTGGADLSAFTSNDTLGTFTLAPGLSDINASLAQFTASLPTYEAIDTSQFADFGTATLSAFPDAAATDTALFAPAAAADLSVFSPDVTAFSLSPSPLADTNATLADFTAALPSTDSLQAFDFGTSELTAFPDATATTDAGLFAPEAAIDTAAFSVPSDPAAISFAPSPVAVETFTPTDTAVALASSDLTQAFVGESGISFGQNSTLSTPVSDVTPGIIPAGGGVVAATFTGGEAPATELTGTDEVIELEVIGEPVTPYEQAAAIADEIIETRPDLADKRGALIDTLLALYDIEKQKDPEVTPTLRPIFESQNKFIFDEVLRIADAGGPLVSSTIFLIGGLQESNPIADALSEFESILGDTVVEETSATPAVAGVEPDERAIPVAGTIGFLNEESGEVLRRVFESFSTPLEGSGKIEFLVGVGDQVTKGQLLAFRDSPELTAELQNAKSDLNTVKAQATGAVANYIVSQQNVAAARIPGLEQQVAGLETALKEAETTRDRYVNLNESGAVANVSIDAQNKTVAEASAALGAARSQLNEARTQASAAQLPAGLTAGQIVDGIVSNNSAIIAKLPAELSSSIVTPIRDAVNRINVFEAKIEANKLYASVSGTVTYSQLTRSAATTSGAGTNAISDPGGAGSASQLDTLSLSIAETGKPPSVKVGDLDRNSALYLEGKVGQQVVIENPFTKERGTATVGALTINTPSTAGASVRLDNVTIGGKPLSQFEGQIAIYLDPDSRPLEAGGSSANVALLNLSQPIATATGLPFREQDFLVTTDIVLDKSIVGQLGGAAILNDEQQVGTVVIRGTVRTDGATVSLASVRAEFQGSPDANTSTTALPAPNIFELSTGGQIAGGSVDKSRLQVTFSPQLILSNTAEGRTVSVSPTGLGASYNTTDQVSSTILPITLDIVPTGRTDEIVRIAAPDSLRVRDRQTLGQ